MNVNIQPATPENVPELTEILNGALQQKLNHNDLVWGTEPYTAEDAARRIEQGATHIAYVDGEAAGAVALLWEDPRMWGEQPPVAGYIHGLAVRPEFAGQGIGERLLEWAADEVVRNGRDIVRLDCPAANEGLCAYYEKLGFTKVAVKPNPANPSSGNTAYFERAVA